ncbi:ATP-binding protein [Bradyrhizobium sp. USDA 4506]
MLTHPTKCRHSAWPEWRPPTGNWAKRTMPPISAGRSGLTWLGLMLDREAATRADKRLTNRLAEAKLSFVDTCIEDIDFAARRGLDRRNTLQPAQGA